MQLTCRHPWCAQPFEITKDDLQFLDRISPVFNGKKEPLPPPTLCPGCRMQRRLAWRNESTLHKRKCDHTGEPIISIFAPGIPYAVWSYDAWWSDACDPLSYGRDFDFSRPFFEQFDELLHVVPLSGSGFKTHCENCDYCNQQNDSRNCYLTFGSGWMEDCAYASWTYYAKDTFDTLGCMHIERCSHLVDCTNMYGSVDCQDCADCTDCRTCFDCRSCQNCTGCMNLHRHRFCLFNEQLTEEEYQKRTAGLSSEEIRSHFQQLKRTLPHRAVTQLNCENSRGDHLTNCKGVTESFHVWDCQDCRFMQDVIEQKDCADCTRTGLSELSYENVSGGRYYHGLFVSSADTTAESCYALGCYFSKNLFGCVSAHHKQYCILNKQYSKEEYETLVPKIIEHMRKTPLRSLDGSSQLRSSISAGQDAGQEWGEFFPTRMSPYAYNETLALEYFPVTKDIAEKRGWIWREKTDEAPVVTKTIPAARLPERIEDIPDDILNWAIICEATSRPFKILKRELEFCRTMQLPVPHLHPDERHRRRMALRNPRKLWKRSCEKCGREIETTYSPERPEIVYCEVCYLKEVY